LMKYLENMKTCYFEPHRLNAEYANSVMV
jgi:hypothetical protein